MKKAWVVPIAGALAFYLLVPPLHETSHTVYPQVDGVRSTVVSQSNISSTVCKPGWTAEVRPAYSYTYRIKVGQIRRYHYKDTDPSSYQEDHLISLELGGSAYSYNNLWPQPIKQARVDDVLENKLNRELCSGQISLAEAQQSEIDHKKKHG